jgi:hypothetical protein
MARSNAARVFSGAWPDAPRWAMLRIGTDLSRRRPAKPVATPQRIHRQDRRRARRSDQPRG